MEDFFDEAKAEARAAQAVHPPYSCAHHGYGVLLEEVDELWDEVRKKRELRDWEGMARELRQIAAVAARFDNEIVFPKLIEKAVFTPLPR